MNTDLNLLEVVANNKLVLLADLLNTGINPNQTIDAAKVTALHIAAQNNNLEAAKLLICAGANPHAKTSPDNETPLDIARLHKHDEMITLLSNCKSNACQT